MLEEVPKTGSWGFTTIQGVEMVLIGVRALKLGPEVVNLRKAWREVSESKGPS